MAAGTVILASLMAFVASRARQITVMLRMRVHHFRVFRNSSLSYFVIETMTCNARFMSVLVFRKSCLGSILPVTSCALNASCNVTIC